MSTAAALRRTALLALLTISLMPGTQTAAAIESAITGLLAEPS